jgi:hypothetical protein
VLGLYAQAPAVTVSSFGAQLGAVVADATVADGTTNSDATKLTTVITADHFLTVASHDWAFPALRLQRHREFWIGLVTPKPHWA